MEQLDVMAVGAHPDDVEIAVGGTLARLVELGLRVGIIDLTDGEPTPGSSGPAERLEEARQAAEILGVHRRITLQLPNRRLFDCFEARVALAKEFRRYRPRVVLGLFGKTPLASPDHWQAMQITDAGVFYSRLSKWDDAFEQLPVHQIPQQFWYPLGFGSIQPWQEPGGFVFDIGGCLAKKLAAIRAYRSQFPPSKDRVFRLVEHQACLLGEMGGTAAGEWLISPKPLVLTTLVTPILQTERSR